jgi:molecular chaperone GrpE
LQASIGLGYRRQPMSDDSDEKPSGGTGSKPPPDVTAGDAAPVSGEVPSAVDPAAETKDPLEVAKADAQRFRDQLLRTAADFDNFRKRSRREADDANRRGRESLLKELLPVFDNLERAATSAETAQDAKSVAEGIRMVLRQFGSTLDRIGVKRVVSVGQPFDPGLHEAIQHVESTEHEAGTVAAEVQAGYQIGEHLVRAALVVVSKGPGPGGGGGAAGGGDGDADAGKASDASEGGTEEGGGAPPEEPLN